MAKSNDDVILKRVKIKKSDDDSEQNINSAAKKSKSKKKNQTQSEDGFLQQYNRHIKIISAILILLSILIILAFISYSPKDEALTQLNFNDVLGLLKGKEESLAKAQQTHNWLGFIGAILSHLFINQSVGYFIVLLPIITMIWSLSLIVYLRVSTKLIKYTISTLVITVFLSSLIGSLARTHIFSGISKEWIGAVGYFISAFLNGMIGAVGSVILLIALILISFVIGFEINVKRILSYISGLAHRLGVWYNEYKKESESKKLSREKTAKTDIKPDTIYNSEEHGEPANIFRNNAEIDKQTVNLDDEYFDPVTQTLKAYSQNIKKQNQENSLSYDKAKSNIETNEPETKREPTITINRNLSESKKQHIINSLNDIVSQDDQKISNDEINQNQSELNQTKPDKIFIVNTEFDKNLSGKPSPQDVYSYSADKNIIEETSEPETYEEEVNTDLDFEVKEENVENEKGIDIVEDYEDNEIEEVVPNNNKKLVVTVHETIINRIDDPINLLSTDVLDEEIEYRPPTLDLLVDDKDNYVIDEEELKNNAKILQEKLETFKIYIENLSVTPGPVVTQYEFVPAAGIKISKIAAFADDIAMALKAKGIRIIAPIPGKGTVGIEIPNRNPELVRFSSCLKSPKFLNSTLKLPLGFGKTISGEIFTTDLSRMPHLLIAGATGMGKSVGINTIITSLLYRMHPKDLKFVFIDPKKVELGQYSMLKNHFLAASPDLKSSIITDPQDAVVILKALCAEMDLRYDILSKVAQRNISDYNRKIVEGKFKDDKEIVHKQMPYIVVIIDEMSDLMLTASKEVETPIIRLAQLARAVGIHLVVATQRPSVDVITGIIKANFPSRISYQVSSKVDSRTILDYIGAEKLLGNGDMLFQAGGSPPIRIQNAYLTTEEVEDICNFIGKQKGYSSPYMLPSVLESKNDMGGISKEDRDPFFEDAARIVIQHQQASVSMIQRRLKVGYARAGRIVDELEAMGVVGPYDGSKARIVLMESESDLEAIL